MTATSTRTLSPIVRDRAGAVQPVLVICESGDAFALLGTQVACWTGGAPSDLGALARAGTLDLDAPVRFGLTVTDERPIPIASPDHKFLEALRSFQKARTVARRRAPAPR